MSKIGLIIKREYSSRVRKKSFLLMTILGPILMVGFLVGAIWIGQENEKDLEILVHDDSYVLADKLKQSTKYHLVSSEDESAKTYEACQEAFKNNDKYDLLLYLPPTIMKTNSGVGKILYKEPPSNKVQNHLKSIVNEAIERHRIQELDIPIDTYKQLKTGVQLHTVDVETMEEKNVGLRAGVGFAFGLMIYIFIFMYGVQVMKGVIEEKSNRIVEVIVSSVRPFELMMGKIIGIMFVGLTQFAIWVILSFSLITVLSLTVFPDMMDPSNQAIETANIQQMAVHLQNDALQNVDMNAVGEIGNEFQDLIFNQINWPLMIGLFIFYFIGGYLLYGSLLAAIGAAVDSETDTQQFMLPVSAPLIFAYIIAISALENPNSSAVVWCSEIPFTSPVVMLVRVAMGAEGLAFQIILSMVLLIGTFIGTTWLAGKIYRTGILMYGKKASYKEMFKWLRHG